MDIVLSKKMTVMFFFFFPFCEALVLSHEIETLFIHVEEDHSGKHIVFVTAYDTLSAHSPAVYFDVLSIGGAGVSAAMGCPSFVKACPL